jgi:hypothetical protein
MSKYLLFVGLVLGSLANFGVVAQVQTSWATATLESFERGVSVRTRDVD